MRVCLGGLDGGPGVRRRRFLRLGLGTPVPCSMTLTSCSRALVVDGCAPDLVVGVEEGLGEEGADVAAAQAVDDTLTLSLALDEPGEAQF